MIIGILSLNRHLYSTRRLIEAGRAHRHQVVVIDSARAALALSRRSPGDPGAALSSNGMDWPGWIPRVDGIIPRIGASMTAQGVPVVRFFEAKGIPTTAASEAIAGSRDKYRSLQVMRAAGLPTPRTALVNEREELEAAVEAVGGFPLLIKLSEGTHGRGVWLIPNLATARAVQRILHERGRRMLVQEFVAEAAGADMRLIIVGGRCVAAMQRRAAKGEFRSNLHLGGSAIALKPEASIKQLAIQAAHSHALDVAGVDIISSHRGPLLLEVNSSPGLEGIERATGRNVAAEIVRHLEKKVRRRQPVR